MDNDKYSKINESFNKIAYDYVEKLPEKGIVNHRYAVNAKPKTDKHKKLLEIANCIAYGGYDGYFYDGKDYIKVIDFWENVEKELKEVLGDLKEILNGE